MKIKTINGKMNIIGANLKKYRLSKGYTQRKLCEKLELLGITMYHSDIHAIEYYKKTVRDFEARAFCIALDITLDELYANTEKEYE